MSNERSLRLTAALPFLGMTLALLGAAHPADPARARAAKYFEEGVARMQAGDPDGARRAFEAAYESSPHYSTLLNLAQAHSALGHPVEAAGTLHRYLEAAKGRLDDAHRTVAESLLEHEEERIGFIELKATPDTAQVLLDGEAVGTTPIARPIPASVGRHALIVRRDGSLPYAEPVDVAAKSTTTVAVQLESLDARATQGELRIACSVPDVAVTVDGAPLRETSMRVTAGSHGVRFERRGYLSHEVTVAVDRGAVREVSCELRPDPAERTGRGVLRLAGRPPEAEVLLDGATFTGVPVPEGRHHLVISAPLFQPWASDVVIAAGGVRDLRVSLIPTEAHRRELLQEKKKRTTWSIVLASGGSALLASAAVLDVWNGNRYDHWQAERASAYAAFQKTPTSARLSQISDVESRSAGIQRTDDVAIGLGIAGGAALITGVLMLLTSE